MPIVGRIDRIAACIEAFELPREWLGIRPVVSGCLFVVASRTHRHEPVERGKGVAAISNRPDVIDGIGLDKVAAQFARVAQRAAGQL